MAEKLGPLGHCKVVGDNQIILEPNKRGEGERCRKVIAASYFPRKIYYTFAYEPEGNYEQPTYIFVNADYAHIDAIFRSLVGRADDEESGISDSFTIRQETNYPLRMDVSMFRIEVELKNPHTSFLSIEETVLLVEHMVKKYGNAYEVKRVSLEEILNL